MLRKLKQSNTKRKSIIFFALLFLAMLTIGCSPSTRLKRLLFKYPELLHTDTLMVSHQIIIPTVEIDTLLFFNNKIDTFLLEKERLLVKIIKRYDTVKINAECKTDTVYIETPQLTKTLITEQKDLKKDNFARFKALLYIVGAIIIIPHVLEYLKVRKKRK